MSRTECRLQTLVSLLSAGPVAPADKIGYLGLNNLWQTIRTDGILLKPDAPARTMDLVFSLGFKQKAVLLNLTNTYSSHIIQDGTNPTFNWHYILAADTLQDITIVPADLGEMDNGNLFVFDYYEKPTVLSRFGDSTPLVIPALSPDGEIVSFKYYVVIQAYNGYAIIGERNKFAVASRQRFVSITKSTQDGTTKTEIVLSGGQNEVVTIEMLYTPKRTIESYTCPISSITATLVCTESVDTGNHACSCA